MSNQKKPLYWCIEGFDSSRRIYRKTIKVGQMTEKQAKDLLRALVAKAGLSYDEMVGAYATRRTKIANDHLAVRSDGPVLWCGNNPHFVVSVRDSDGKVPRRQFR